MGRSRPPVASAIPAMIVRAVPRFSCGICGAASQMPAIRISKKPISAKRLPVCPGAPRRSSPFTLWFPVANGVGLRTATTDGVAHARSARIARLAPQRTISRREKPVVARDCSRVISAPASVLPIVRSASHGRALASAWRIARECRPMSCPPTGPRRIARRRPRKSRSLLSSLGASSHSCSGRKGSPRGSGRACGIACRDAVVSPRAADAAAGGV